MFEFGLAFLFCLFLGFADIYDSRWFAGKIPRNRAERLVLQNQLPQGAFLIREREAEQSMLSVLILKSCA